MSTIDVTIACSGSSLEETVAALEHIAPRLRECRVRAEFLVLLAGGEAGLPDQAGGFPLREAPLERPTCGDALRAAVREARGDWLITLENPSPPDASLVFGFCHRRN